MKSVILAGGFGTRIRPLTLSIPKPFIDFCNRPSLEYQVKACKKAGIDHIILAVFAPFNLCDDVKKLAEKYSVRIDISQESTPMGTAGSLRLAKDLICQEGDDSDMFLTFNSDIICNYPLEDMIKSHRKNNAKVTILVTNVENPKDFGVVVYDENNKIESFVEKPNDMTSNKINAGVYVLSKEVLDFIPLRNCSIEKEFFPKYLKFGTSYAHQLKGYWSDIGKPLGYLNAQNLHLSYLSNHDSDGNEDPNQENPQSKTIEELGVLLLSSFESPTNSFSTPTPSTEPHSVYGSINFKGPVLIHPSCVIGDDCLIGPNVVVGPNVRIGDGCRILNSTLLADVEVESHCYIEDTIIGWESVVKKWTRIEGLSVFGKGVVVSQCLFLRGCVVLPHKAISSSIYESGQVII